jgi:multidrug resistance efflux pump
MNWSKYRPALAYAGRMAVTLLVVALAVIAGRRLWAHYQLAPWTRDGRVRADVVQLAPDVSGLVTRVVVVNDQPVKRGDPLFYIDRDRFELALRQADATVEADRAALAEAKREAARNEGLGELVALETTQQSRTKVDQAQAALDQALAARDTAALNLQRTEVKAPLDGYLSDLTLRVGDYVSPGKPVLGLIDAASFRIEGYFEETKLRDLRVGQPATVKLMGETRLLKGHIASIASGIADRERMPSPNLLPNVNPTFSWVRLAQRVPVRITVDHIPPGVRLVAGRTATVWIDVGPGAARR